MADTCKTKLFTSEMAGAPVLSGTAGSLINLLDAVLVNGFGLQTVTSLVVTDGVAVVSVATTPSAVVGSVVLISGATPAGLNGEQRVTAIASNSVSFATTEANGTATGSISMKVAAAGWSKPFTGTNLAAYKMGSVEGTGFLLRVDDTGTTTSRVRGYETMSSISAGVGAFPAVAQIADPGLWIAKSSAADATARLWKIVADQRGVFVFVKQYGTSAEYLNCYFGDILSLKSNDPYACVIRAHASSHAITAVPIGTELGHLDLSYSYGGLYMSRAANTLGGAVQAFNTPALTVGTNALGGPSGALGLPYPSQVDNGLMLSPITIYNASGIRGYYPGVYASPQITNTSFSSGDSVVGSGSVAGKSVMVIKSGAPTAGATQGVLFIDTTSDWRV